MLMVALSTLFVLIISLGIARYLIGRSRPWLGIILGLLPLAVMEWVMQWTVNANIRDCLDLACASAGMPPGCTIYEFGCTEWSDLSRFVFWAAGFIDLVLYGIGVGVLLLISARRKHATTRSAGSGFSEGG